MLPLSCIVDPAPVDVSIWETARPQSNRPRCNIMAKLANRMFPRLNPVTGNTPVNAQADHGFLYCDLAWWRRGHVVTLVQLNPHQQRQNWHGSVVQHARLRNRFGLVVAWRREQGEGGCRGMPMASSSNQVTSLLHDIVALKVVAVPLWGSLVFKQYKMKTVSLVELKTLNNLQCSIERIKGQAYSRAE
jgi:hypothetical protein